MADTLITGTTLVEKESRSIGDIPISGIVEWDDSIPGTPNIPEGFLECDGSTIIDALSSINGQTIPNLNTQYINLSGAHFNTTRPTTDNILTSNSNGRQISNAEGNAFIAGVTIPDEATITEVITYGNAAAESGITWKMIRVKTEDLTTVTMATAAVGTADTSITSGEIDTSQFSYFITCTTAEFDAADENWGARITYTPRNKFIIRVR